MQIKVVSLRRYPVKSMGGEALDSVALDPRGLAGDRWFAVEDEDGHFASGKNSRRFRRRDPVFSYSAGTATSGEVTVTGPGGEWQAMDPALDDELTAVMGVGVRVRPEADVSHQDSGSVSLVGTATLAWCAERWNIDPDPRRLRVNILLATDEPFIEEQWVGQEITIGDIVLRGVRRIPRCRMVDIDQDGARVEGRLLKPLTQERDMCLAVYADVVRTGVLRVGDEVSVSA
ncbi:hypothetical protein BJ980_002052 [Nocardioides daedukensis]|uniref:MOSC domain-containing protein n=1 Tax=Nocardioides daedukensis TaxID=634462 RepID=A0A7Y9UTT7_9ACTN|nr:MOSC N-terminal beta barrel domain-containing protein [Nocardioides daedukensis]NYG59129.1 hypothetical protein [Nocardioides daedukensis]